MKNNFVTIVRNNKKIDFGSNNSYTFLVANDPRLHLGDKFFLLEICKRLNLALRKPKKKDSTSFTIALTLAKRLDFLCGDITIGINWSRPMYMSVEEHIRFELKKLDPNFQVFDLRTNKKRILFAPEIASSPIRTFGLRSRFYNLLKIFQDNGFEIDYLGLNPLISGKNNYGIRISHHISSVDLGLSRIRHGNYFALVGFDNFWMHVAVKYNLRTYIVQRRKFSFKNYLNHISSLNVSCKNNIQNYIS
jgi:hypothetical protein